MASSGLKVEIDEAVRNHTSREDVPKEKASKGENPHDLDSADPLSRFRDEFFLPINRAVGGDGVGEQQRTSF